MTYKTIITSASENIFEITIHRPEAKNSINQELLNEMHAALDEIEHNEAIRCVALRGEEGFFCTGMDFKEVSQVKMFTKQEEKKLAGGYMGMLKRFSSFPKIIVSICDGKVLAGGVGLAAASDLVIATPTTEFGLSEALWGLLPANVMPFLIRRVGFQPAYVMTMTTKNISGQKAQEMNLVDVCSEDPEREFKILNRRLSMLHPKTIHRMKAYFQKMWIINEEMEKLAIDTLVELKMDPMVQDNIKNFIEKGKFPWESK